MGYKDTTVHLNSQEDWCKPRAKRITYCRAETEGDKPECAVPVKSASAESIATVWEEPAMQFPRARGCDRADNGNQAGHILLVGVVKGRWGRGNTALEAQY